MQSTGVCQPAPSRLGTGRHQVAEALPVDRIEAQLARGVGDLGREFGGGHRDQAGECRLDGVGGLITEGADFARQERQRGLGFGEWCRVEDAAPRLNPEREVLLLSGSGRATGTEEDQQIVGGDFRDRPIEGCEVAVGGRDALGVLVDDIPATPVDVERIVDLGIDDLRKANLQNQQEQHREKPEEGREAAEECGLSGGGGTGGERCGRGAATGGRFAGGGRIGGRIGRG